MSSPCLDQDLGFGKTVEDFAIEQFIAQAAICSASAPMAQI
jgi:hypothetical protein